MACAHYFQPWARLLKLLFSFSNTSGMSFFLCSALLLSKCIIIPL